MFPSLQDLARLKIALYILAHVPKSLLGGVEEETEWVREGGMDGGRDGEGYRKGEAKGEGRGSERGSG